ncbi:MAG TPA: PAS domain-containing protein [Bacteroidia bacterium]|jgi:PAS domain S-box-containing protein|nr:PAS domain-containing protein [Bacteroidia bacterium]
MELIKNIDLFQTVFESVSSGITVIQPIKNEKGEVEDFSILLFNSYMLTWVEDKNYKGKRYGDVFPILKETGIIKKLAEIAENGITANFEYLSNDRKRCFRFTAVKQAELLVVTTEEITARKQADIALNAALDNVEKQKRLYDSIINNTPDLVYVFDLNYKFTYANKALLTMWGKSAEHAIGKGLRDNGYEEWHALMHEREIDEVVATKKPIRGTVSFPHAELGSRVYDYILVPVINEKGEVEAIAGTTRDITDSKQIEEKIQQSEARLKTMIDQTPAPTLVLTGDDLVVEQINDSMLKIIGHGEEIVGQPLIKVMPELEGQYIWEQVKKVYKEGITFDQSEVCVPHNRTGVIQDYYYNIAYRPLKEKGKITGMIQVAVDVTEQVAARKKLERSEGNFRALINATSDVVYRMNADWTIMHNLEGRGFLSDTDEPILNWMDKYIHPNDRERVSKAVEKAIANKSTFELVHQVLDAEGNLGWTFSRAVPILDEHGKIREWFGAASDVTERKKAEHALKNSEIKYKILSETLEEQVDNRTKELQRSNEDLQQFAHVASHDLKEPVRKIKTFINRLEEHLDGKLDDLSKRFIERIHVASDRMYTMIDGVLTYSKINADRQKPELVNLNEVIKNIETDLEIALQRTDGKIQYHQLPTLEGAPVLLYQLFYNLINNSIKFAKTDVPPHITITSEIEKGNKKNTAHIAVKDNGVGFESYQADKIFETFTRLNSKDKYEGTGLGLSLCKKIVERHGGTITANSNPGKGATFVIKLPLQQEENDI